MTQTCRRHPGESTHDSCDECGYDFCVECLLHALGPKKPPLCIDCAMSRAGVRAGTNPRRSFFQRRREERARRRAAQRLDDAHEAAVARAVADERAARVSRPDEDTPARPRGDDWSRLPSSWRVDRGDR